MDIKIHSIHFDADKKLVYFEVIDSSAKKYPIENGYEMLINGISDRIVYLILRFEIDKICIEGLSFMAKSSVRDVIDGLQWNVRCTISRQFQEILVGIIPVKSWRNWFLSPDERKKKKKKCPTIKDITFFNLPDSVRKKFILYVEEENLNFDALYDLGDSYAMGIYRLSLNEG